MALTGDKYKSVQLFDYRGGSSHASSPTSTIFPKLPPFLDSDFSNSSPASPQDSSLVHVPLAALRCRITEFEGLLCDYRALLGRQPRLLETVPPPFNATADKAWHAALAKRRVAFSLLGAAAGTTFEGDHGSARIHKRMRAYIALLRASMLRLQRNPDYYFAPDTNTNRY